MQAQNRGIPGVGFSVGAAAGGDVARTVEELWERHALSVFLFARSRLSNREDARDVCQETFIRAMRSLQASGCGAPADPRHGAWLKKIAANIMIDRHRSPQTRMGCGRGGDDAEFGEVLAELKGGGPQPGAPAQVDKSGQIEALRACLERLGPRKRLLVEMRGLREHDYPAIERQLGVSSGAARVMFFRALRELRECIEIRTGVVDAGDPP